MENATHTPATSKFDLAKLAKQAGLDPSNQQHVALAKQVMYDVQALQQPDRQQELASVMQGFGMNPAQHKQNIQDYHAQRDQLAREQAGLVEKHGGAESKLHRNGMIKFIAGLAAAITAFVLTNKRLKKNDDVSKWRKFFEKTLITLGSLVGTRVLTSFVTTRPANKRINNINDELAQVEVNLAKNPQELQAYMDGIAEVLGAKMLKARLEEQEKQQQQQQTQEMTEEVRSTPSAGAEPPAVKTADTQEVDGAPVTEHQTPAKKLLENEHRAVSPEAIAAKKEAANSAELTP